MWTREHLITLLPAVAVYIVIAVVLALILRNKSEKIKMIPSMIIGLSLLALEIGKQVYAFNHGYDLFVLPLHFCSQFFWMIPLMAFYFGKHKYLVRSVATTASMMLFIALMIYPNSIYSAISINNFFKHYPSFQTVAFHNLVLLNLSIVLALKVNKFSLKRDILANIAVFGAYCLVAGVMSQVLKTNYNNFYTNIVVWVDQFRMNLIHLLGMFGQAIYVVIFSLLLLLGSVGSYLILRAVDMLIDKFKRKEVVNEQNN